MTTQQRGEHHITIPAKKNLTIGKINAVLWEMVRHFGMDRKELLNELFG